jgi:protein involved in polysaccharide export with SLBB domain
MTASESASTSSRSLALPEIYNVGAGDVLDIRLPNTPTRDSTLYTVLKNGTIEYPLLNGPLAVAGMTTDGIARRLANEIKVIRAAKINVTVREYASHSIVVSGLVDNPGRKILRRESMPLYAVLAESAVRSEASTVTVVHKGKDSPPLALKDERAMATLVYSGDAIRISSGNSVPNQYVYVGGAVAAPGEKILRSGMTLTQVLLAAGANLSATKTAKVARRNPSGLLSTIEYNVNAIGQGRTADPQVVPGDRIEVIR